MVVRDSNSVFLTILDPLPQENIGWWLEFYDFATESLLARVYTYWDFSFSVPLSDIGAGEINMSAYDPLWTSTLPNTEVGTYILDGGSHYVRFIDEGVERQRIILDGHDLGRVREDGSRPRVLRGRGVGVVLDWGVVLPTSIGASTSGNRTFSGVHWAGVWRTLFLEAQARGAIPSWVYTTFDTTYDSHGTPWGDVGDYEIPEGQSLLDLLQQFQEQHGFEWRMSPQGVLSAAPNLGDSRADDVRFFEHEAIITADDSQDQKDLRTHVYVLGGDNLVTLAADGTVPTHWGRREKWVSQASATNSNSRSAIANTLLGLAKEPLKSRTFKVPFNPKHPDTGADTGRRAFRDYETGMVIGYGPQTDSTTNFRVVEMAVKVDANKTELELTVMSRRQREIDRLSKLLTRILAGQTGIAGVGGASGSISSTVIASAIRLGSLLDVDVLSAVPKDTIVYDGSNWVAGRNALDDLSDVSVSGASPGSVLTLSGGVWVGSAAPGGSRDRQWLAGSGETSIDEFNDDALAGAWSRVDKSGGSGRCTWTESGDVLSAYNDGGDAGGELHGLMRSVGTSMVTGDAFITAYRIFAPIATYVMGGIILADGLVWTSGNTVHSLSYSNAGVTQNNDVRQATGYNSTTNTGNVSSPIGMMTYCRLVKLASNTWRADYSPDGVSWVKGTAVTTLSFTPTYVGLLSSSWATSTKGITTYEFLRRTSGVT